MSNTSSRDEIYYAHAGKAPLVSRLSLYARKALFARFMALMKPGPASSVLDLGVSLDVNAIEANVLERLYEHPENITCAGLEPSDAVERTYPGVSFVKIEPHGRLPFADGRFDIVYSNAVLEHAGSRAEQAAFVREALRVSKRAFIVVPNRLFPVEQHTALPLLHYLPQPVFSRLLRPTPWAYWADEANLNHLYAHQLRALFPEPERVGIEYAGIGLGPFRSNLIAYT